MNKTYYLQYFVKTGNLAKQSVLLTKQTCAKKSELARAGDGNVIEYHFIIRPYFSPNHR